MTELRYEVKLTKLSTNENKVRTKEVVGVCAELPKVGKYFVMFAEALDKMYSARMVSTSRIKEIETTSLHIGNGGIGDRYRLTTENSEYTVEVLGDLDAVKN